MKKYLWVYSLLLLVVLLSACAAQPLPQPGQSVGLEPTMPPAATVEEKVATLLPDDGQSAAAQPTTPPSPTLDEKAQETAIANLRTLLSAPQLELFFKGPDRSPNATSYPAMLFVDAQDNSYYVNPNTLQPIEFTQQWATQQGGAKTADELRAIAAQMAEKHSTQFAALKDTLTYTEGIKGENNFFRWEVPDTDMGGMPAILQVGLKQDGTLFSYLNSLDLLP